MTKDEFFKELTDYYFAPPKKVEVRIKYLTEFFIDYKVPCNEDTIRKITNHCRYFPTVTELREIFPKPSKVLPPVQ